MDLPSLSSRLQNNIMRDSSSLHPRPPPHPWEPETAFPEDDDDDESRGGFPGRIIRPPGICVPRPLSDSEFDDIERCFLRANARVPGYLDCSELKVYMDLRKCPITQWEAEKLLEYADTTYNYYITLQQVTNLALHFGIGTQHPLRLTRSEFELAIQRSFRGELDNNGNTISNNNAHNNNNSASLVPSRRASFTQELDFEGVVNYFESKAVMEAYDSPEEDEEESDDEDDEEEEEDDEPVIEEIQVSKRGQKSSNWHTQGCATTVTPTPTTPRSGADTNIRKARTDTYIIRTREVGSQTDYAHIPSLTPLQLINYAYPTKSKGGGGHQNSSRRRRTRRQKTPRITNTKTRTPPLPSKIIDDDSDPEEEQEEEQGVGEEDEEINIDDEPLEPVRKIKERWEKKIRKLIATNGDDFLVKLDQDRRQKLAAMKLQIGKNASDRQNNVGKGRQHGRRVQNNNHQPLPKPTRMEVAINNAPIITYRTTRHTPATPTVKAIFKREQQQQMPSIPPMPRISSGHKLKKVAEKEGEEPKTRKTRGKGGTRNKMQPPLPPPLPPPIVPEFPTELRSTIINATNTDKGLRRRRL